MLRNTRKNMLALATVLAGFITAAIAGDGAPQQTPSPSAAVRPTDTDGAMIDRRESVRFYSAGFGPADLYSLGSSGLAYSFFGTTYWEVDPSAGIRAVGEMTTDFTDGLLLDLNLGANLYFSERPKVAPFAAADMGFGYGRGRGDNAVGFSLGASGGVLLFRQSDRQMQLEVRLGTILDKIKGSFPTQFAGRLGIVF